MANVTAPAARSQAHQSPLTRPVTLGVIVGNRGFFPHHLAPTGGETILEVLEEPVSGGYSRREFSDMARLNRWRSPVLRRLFRQHRDSIDGILVTLPNFGDERAIANTLRLAGWMSRSWSTPFPTTWKICSSTIVVIAFAAR